METQNLTERCRWLSEENRTEPLDAAQCLFLSMLPHRSAVQVLVSVVVLLTLFSLLANGFTLFGVKQSEDLTCEPRLAFLKNLVSSDLIQTLTFGPSIIHSLIGRRTMAFNAWCKLQFFVGTVCIFSSLLTITFMALERYLYVCHAISYLVIVKPQRVRFALLVIWVYSVSTSTVSIMLLHMGTGQQDEQVTNGLLCEPDMMEQHMGFPRAFAVFRKVTGVSTLLLCILVYAFSYLRMYQDARNAVVPFDEDNCKARNTVMFYCGMLFLQLLPLLFKVVSDALWEVEGTATVTVSAQDVRANTSRTASSAVLHLCLLVMLLVPPCVNPLVYGLRSVEMRRMVANLFQWCAAVREVESIRDAVRPNAAQA